MFQICFGWPYPAHNIRHQSYWRDLNPRPHPYQGGALPTELQQRVLESLKRVKGIEPSYSAWKAAALPLSYTRVHARDRCSLLFRLSGRLSSFLRHTVFCSQQCPVFACFFPVGGIGFEPM